MRSDIAADPAECAAEAVQAFELQSFAADAEDLNGTPPGFRHADGTRAADGTPV